MGREMEGRSGYSCLSADDGISRWDSRHVTIRLFGLRSVL
jgi:hypothetical protein